MEDQVVSESLEVAMMLVEVFCGGEVAGVEELALNMKRPLPCHTNQVKFMKPKNWAFQGQR